MILYLLLLVSFGVCTVQRMSQGFLETGEFKNSLKVAHGRETLPLPVPDMSENFLQQF